MQIGEQYGLAELQQFMAGRGHMLTLAQEMPQDMHSHHIQYQQQQQQLQFHAGFHQHHQAQLHPQSHAGSRMASICAQQYQASSNPPQQEENHHSYHLQQAQRHHSNSIAQQLSLGSDSPAAPSVSVSPSSKRTISPPGIVSKQSVNAVARDQAFEDYDEPFDDGDRGSNGRWPRQETLTLLKIRSEMDPKFREATHKGPLWDEVSRDLAEHGYQRNAKKCREKFENLYKYYKKTKEGKAGRQDGKHYRFFSQLEALYGGAALAENGCNDAADSACFGGAARTNLTENASGLESKFLENYHNNNNSAFNLSSDSSSSDDDCSHFKDQEETVGRGKRKRKHWKSKVKMYFDFQMKKFMDKQEAWLQKVLETLEQREQERITREECWRRQESARLDREHQLWTTERARAASCDAAFISALQKITGQNLQVPQIITAPPQITDSKSNNPEGPDHHQLLMNREVAYDPNNKRWPKAEILSLIRLRTSMEPRFQEAGSKGPLWEEISSGMSCLGYDRSAKRCKEKWENINKYFRKAKDSNRKRPENSKTCPYFQQLDSLYRQGALGLATGCTDAATGADTATASVGTKAPKLADDQTADELVLQPCSSSHDNDDLPHGREAVEMLGLTPSEDGINNNNTNADSMANSNTNNNAAGGASSNTMHFFSGADNGGNWEGYPMKIKMKQQAQHLMDTSHHHHHQTAL